MKTLLIMLFCLLVTNSFAQYHKIGFKIVDNQIRTDETLAKLNLPIEFEFTKDFKNKTISILNDKDEVIALKNCKFGEGLLVPLGDLGTYNITIDANGLVNPPTGDDKKIVEKKIILKIGNENNIVLTFDNNTQESTNKKETKSETIYQPGYIFYDALFLSDPAIDISIKKNILISYGITNFKDTSNLYLNDLIKEIKEMKTIEGEDITGFGTLLTNLGKIDVTYFATGLARFLAERTKDELTEAFFDRMREKMNAYPELKTIFPKTASFLNVIESYSYASVLQVLKEAFETDMQSLPENLYNIKYLTEYDCEKISICGNDENCKDYTKCKERLKNLSEFFSTQNGHWVSLGMLIFKEAIHSSNPADLLESVNTSPELNELKKSSLDSNKFSDYNIVSSIELCNFISRSMRSKEDKQIWISPVQMNTLLRNQKAFEIYLGLLLTMELTANEKDKVVINFYKPDNSTITFGKILIKAYGDYKNISNLISNIYTAYNAANNACKKIIDASEKSVTADPQALYSYYKVFTSSLNAIVHSKLINEKNGKEIGISYDKIEKYLNPSVDFAYHISTKKYSAALYDAVQLLNNTSSSVFNKEVTESFYKYGTLISTIASAQSSDEVKQGLEASVLPAGSYSVKRKTDWSLGINAYVGAFYSNNNNSASKDYWPEFGMSAPINFNISKGFSKNGDYGGLSLNLQILDLGALVNYYFIKGDTASIPNDFKVKLSNIFSPGFSLCYNIPKFPLSFAWGCQYIPSLYKYEQINGQKELIPTNVWRWQISLMVDIPLYNIKVWNF